MISVAARMICALPLSAFLLALAFHAEFAFAGSEAARHYASSLTADDRKLPQHVLIADRVQRGRAVPESISRGVRLLSSAPDVNTYRVQGTSRRGLNSALNALNLGVGYRFAGSAEAFLNLTADQVLQLAEHGGVRRIRLVSPARPQGVANAQTAHRTTEVLKGGAATSGADVVIAIISSAFSQADVTLFQQSTSAPDVIPGNDSLFVLPGSDVTAGETRDAIHLLEVVYKIAPDATFILASPGASGSAQGMAAAIDALVAGETTDAQERPIPVPDIIIDDLLFTAESPFGLGVKEQAIIAATEAGIVYVTSAGDMGAANNSGVYISDLAPVLDSGAWVHPFPDNSNTLVVSQALADVCFFTNAVPDNFVSNDPLAFVVNPEPDGAGGVIDRTYVIDGEGCLSEGYTPEDMPVINENATIEVVFTDDSVHRLLVAGPRAASVDLLQIAPAFNHTSESGILGHAFLPEVVTVSGAAPCADVTSTVLSYKDCPDPINPLPFSSPGDTDLRFFWESGVGAQGEATFSELAAPLGASKPDILALGGLTVTDLSETGEPSQIAYVGTSVSAAAVAGIAALNWEYRYDAAIPQAPVGLEVVAALRASGLAFDQGHNTNSGYGPIDAPQASEINQFDEPLKPQNVQLLSVPGGVQLQFQKSADDLNDAFFYGVDCGSLFSGDLRPSDTGLTDEAISTVPFGIASTGTVACDVTPRQSQTANPYVTSKVSVEADSGSDPSPVGVSMTAKAGGAELTFSASPLEATLPGLFYSATCTVQNDGPAEAIEGWSPKVDALSSAPYPFLAEPGATISCEVKVVAPGAEDPVESETTSDSAVALDASDPEVNISSDTGGVQITWLPDPELIDGAVATASLSCQVGEASVSVTDLPQSYFLEVESDVSVTCTVAVEIRLDANDPASIIQSYTSPPLSAVAEEMLRGLPIWMIYEITKSASTEAPE